MNQYDPPNPGSIESYTIAWICALEEEYFCASRMLDEEFTGPDISEDKDDNTYLYGRIAKHYVVIGCLPAGRYGTNSAACVARDMVRTFPHLRFALMVGIGGGAPTAQSDIRLGDVVVSQPKNGFGGVIQYDLGKTLQSGQFQRNGQLNAPPEKLLGVIPEIRRLYMDKKKQDRLAEHLQRLDDMEDYQKPALDHLYTADYLHVNGKNCGHCYSQSLVGRPVRSNHRAIFVHYGTIASGNSVVKDAKMRDLYANDPELKVLCFEMEAAGLMNNIPCLVIRGICDYCDSHKNDAWHNYAALTAAAYARELLLVLRSQKVDAMPPWADRVQQGLQQVHQSLNNLNNSQRAFQTTVKQLPQEIATVLNWDRLPIVKDAAFDSYVNQHDEVCLLGTRTELLIQITQWSESSHGKPIFWLNGRAGTGKSTISRTLSKSFKDRKVLGASFFFKRGEGDRGNAKKLFPTIIWQLVASIPQLSPAVQKVLHDEPDIASKSLKEQFDKLILQPMLGRQSLGSLTSTVVIVIDALDESDQDEEMRIVLNLLTQLRKINALRLRVFVTSRPEWPILQEFSKITSHEHEDLILHEVPEPVIQRDISLFLEHRLSEIQKARSLPIGWPGEVHLKNLVNLSVPLFIFAATACRLLEDPHWDPDASLAEILAHQDDGSKFHGTYLPVLDRLLQGQEKRREIKLVQEFHKIVGTIVMLESPLSVSSLSNFLDIPKETICRRLSSLHSVLNIPKDLNRPVRIFHLSFRDFLLDPETRNKTRFGLDEKEMHYRLAEKCLLMCQNLRKNICGLESDGTFRAEVDRQIIDDSFPAELRYSCRYWAHHTIHCMDYSDVIPRVLSFLKTHFLYWVEAMSLLGLISEVVGTINLLQSALQGDHYFILSAFLHDAKRFILKNHQIADRAPLQLYCTGLIFAPETAIIRREFEKELPPWITQLPQVNTGWSTEIQTLEGHTYWVDAVAFSPNGRLLASGSGDQSVRLWDPASGALQQTLEGHTSAVHAVAFSPDGRLLASGSEDHTVRLWDPASGALQQTLEGHTSSVAAVAFLTDGRLLASGSDDKTVRLWDPASGALQETLEGHTSAVHAVAFSPNGRLLASCSGDNTVRLWDPASGALQLTLKAHTSSVNTVAFSPDGRLLASGSRDKTVRLWDPASGALQQTLKGHTSWVHAVAFSPDGRLLASGSVDDTVRLWDPASRAPQLTLEGHTSSVAAVAFSPNGRLLASGSDDHTVRLWDPASGALQQTLEGHTSAVHAVAFSPNGRLLASGSGDHTVRLWDPASGALQQTLEGHTSSVHVVAFSPDGWLLASGSEDHTVRLWDPASGALQLTLKAHTSWVHAVAFSPDGQVLASGSRDKTVRLWDPASGALQLTLKGHTSWVHAVAFSPDGWLLASGSDDHTVRLWDPASGALQQTLKGHTSAVHAVAFSPDGRLLASGSDDDTVCLWDLASGALQQTSTLGHAVTEIEFTSDGDFLKTNLGLLQIEHGRVTRSIPPSLSPKISIYNEWVVLQGEKILWLPTEYRPACSAVNNNIIALGRRSGNVSFLGFYM
ncbi:hypothetical protein N7540_013074 [Penicillium herquei]|nr:hypothetical protein N7540_013074 [Penicillium herquei]